MVRTKGKRPETTCDLTRWVEVDLDNLAHNLREVRNYLPAAVTLLAVVKADAYGHGAVPVARTALLGGASYLGVTRVEEALELRAAQIMAPILVMGAILPEEAEKIVAYDLTATVFTDDIAERLDYLGGLSGRKVKVHIKVDTGMGRYGLPPADTLELIRRVRRLEYIEVEGIYTHFAAAFVRDSPLTRQQFAAFQSLLATLAAEGLTPQYQHAASSAAALRYPETALSMVRIGSLLYGQGPVPEISTVVHLRPTWQLKARLTAVRPAAAGTNIGYGRDFHLRTATTIGVLPIGFADGYLVQSVNRPARMIDLFREVVKDIVKYFQPGKYAETVLIRDHRAPLLGRVGMQHCVVDLGAIPDAAVGDAAVLDGKRSTVSARIPKVYRQDGQLTREPYRTGRTGRPAGHHIARRLAAATKS